MHPSIISNISTCQDTSNIVNFSTSSQSGSVYKGAKKRKLVPNTVNAISSKMDITEQSTSKSTFVATVPTKNSFNVLDEENSAAIQSVVNAPTKTNEPKPPTIFVYHEKTGNVLEVVTNAVKFKSKIFADYLSLNATTIADHRSIISALKEHRMEHFTVSPKRERPVKLLLKGVAKDFEVAEVEDALRAKSLPFISFKFHVKSRQRQKTNLQ